MRAGHGRGLGCPRPVQRRRRSARKRFIPDFTFNSLALAVEVKLCKEKDRERVMIDEICADIVGYAGRYDRIIFVVYDLGFIRDVAQFRTDIEKQGNVHVHVVKKQEPVTPRTWRPRR